MTCKGLSSFYPFSFLAHFLFFLTSQVHKEHMRRLQRIKSALFVDPASRRIKVWFDACADCSPGTMSPGSSGNCTFVELDAIQAREVPYALCVIMQRISSSGQASCSACDAGKSTFGYNASAICKDCEAGKIQMRVEFVKSVPQAFLRTKLAFRNAMRALRVRMQALQVPVNCSLCDAGR